SGKIIRFKTKLSSDLKKAIELFNSGNEDDAIKIYISILKSEPANPEANEKVGYYYFDSGEMEKARNYILKSLKYTRNRSELYFIMGDILKDERRNKSSLNFYLKGLELNRDDYVSKYKIGEIYNLLGDYGSAIKYLKEIPDDFNGAVSYQLAKANLHKGDLEGAKKLFHHLKEKYPDQVYGFLGLGKLEFIKKEYYSSIKILKIAYEIDKNNFEVKKYLAMDYNLTGQIGKAERVFPSASSGEIKDLELSLAFAIGYMKSRNYNSSEDVLLNVITEFPDHYRAYFLLGNTFKAQNRNEEAIANYDNALKRTKNADEIAEIKENME
ncbi:tetratricopeptide repeat protein, partial [bacterium]|nr:tetratricopeptide repeat protein [bacterium]